MPLKVLKCNTIFFFFFFDHSIEISNMQVPHLDLWDGGPTRFSIQSSWGPWIIFSWISEYQQFSIMFKYGTMLRNCQTLAHSTAAKLQPAVAQKWLSDRKLHKLAISHCRQKKNLTTPLLSNFMWSDERVFINHLNLGDTCHFSFFQVKLFRIWKMFCQIHLSNLQFYWPLTIWQWAMWWSSGYLKGSSEIILFSVISAQFWPACGPEMTENWFILVISNHSPQFLSFLSHSF